MSLAKWFVKFIKFSNYTKLFGATERYFPHKQFIIVHETTKSVQANGNIKTQWKGDAIVQVVIWRNVK